MERTYDLEEPIEISLDIIDSILKYLPIFEQEGFSFCKWEHDGEHLILKYAKEVSDFSKVLYDTGFIYYFSWSNWEHKAKEIYINQKLLDSADLLTIRRLLITHVRKENFCDGHFAEMLEQGHIQAILRQLKRIRVKM
jgi:O-acetyl-ADP-ribose deacetylase